MGYLQKEPAHFMKKNINTSKVALYASIVLSLISFILTYFLDPLKYTSQSSLAAIPAFLLSVVILIIGQIISIQCEVEKVSSDSDRVCETVKNYLHVTKLGTPKSAWKYVIDRLPVLEYVQNTSFNFDAEIEKTCKRLYDDNIYRRSANEIAKYIDQGLRWEDIGDELAIERFKNVRNCLHGKAKRRYIFRLIGHSEPQIGFILLTYKDGTTEVLFNWDFRDIPQDPVVLLSRDHEIFNMFAAQYNGLWHVATEDYDSIATRSTS